MRTGVTEKTPAKAGAAMSDARRNAQYRGLFGVRKAGAVAVPQIFHHPTTISRKSRSATRTTFHEVTVPGAVDPSTVPICAPSR